MSLRLLIEDLKGRSYKDKTYRVLKAAGKPTRLLRDYLKFNGSHVFEDRVENHQKMVYILIGYKPYLWDQVLGRFEEAVEDENIDVCLISSGTYDQKLESLAEEKGWSYLHSTDGRLGQDQNLAIKYHPEADYIFKLDEDILIESGYFESIIQAYEKADREGNFELGYIAPVLNVNTFSYRYFLEYMGEVEGYKEKFDEIKSGTGTNVEIFNNPEAAIFCWEKSLPFEDTVEKFSENEEIYSPITTRFNIGAIMYTREFWGNMDYFDPGHEDQLGIDEDEIAMHCAKEGLTPIMSTKTFAGHFSFKPQEEKMKEFWREKVGFGYKN